MAALAIVYALVLPVVIGRPRDVWRLSPHVGLPLCLVPILAWLAAAWIADPQHVREVLLGAELVDRIGTATPEGHVKPWWQAIVWFYSKTFAWIFFTLGGLGLAIWQARRTGDRATLPIAAGLWCVVVLVGVSLSSGKRVDYILPAMMPGGMMAAFFLTAVPERLALLRPRLTPVATLLPVLAVVAYAAVVARNSVTRGVEASTGWTADAVTFAEAARNEIGDDDLLVLIRGKTPLPTLLGVHHGDGVTDADLARADWIITEVVPDRPAVLVSPALPSDFEPGTSSLAIPHGLYRRGDLTPADLHAARQNMLTWTTAENPYRRTTRFPARWDDPPPP